MNNNYVDYLPPKEENFNDFINRLYPEDDRGVYELTFQITEDCCLACTYCYQHNKSKNKMTFDTAKKVIDKILNDEYELINTKNTCGLIIDFIGGEPLLETDLIIQITDYYFNQAIQKQHEWLLKTKISICSNGILYFNPNFQKFLNKYNGFISFTISIDGNKDLHDSCRIDLNGQGSYDRAMEAVMHYRTHYNNYIGTKMTLAPENIFYLYDSITDLINKNFQLINLNCVFEDVWENYDTKIFYNELIKIADYLIDNSLYNKINLSIFDEDIGEAMTPEENTNWCGGCLNNDGKGSSFAVNHQGKFYSCIRYMDSSLNNKQPELPIGDINHDFSFTSEEKNNIQKLSDITRRSQSTDECFFCPVARGCSWCSAFNYEETGTPNKRVIYICKMHKTRVLANLYYWNKIYKTLNINLIKNNNISKEESISLIGEENYYRLINIE